MATLHIVWCGWKGSTYSMVAKPDHKRNGEIVVMNNEKSHLYNSLLAMRMSRWDSRKSAAAWRAVKWITVGRLGITLPPHAAAASEPVRWTPAAL